MMSKITNVIIWIFWIAYAIFTIYVILLLYEERSQKAHKETEMGGCETHCRKCELIEAKIKKRRGDEDDYINSGLRSVADFNKGRLDAYKEMLEFIREYVPIPCHECEKAEGE